MRTTILILVLVLVLVGMLLIYSASSSVRMGQSMAARGKGTLIVVGGAMYCHDARHNCFPPAAVFGKDGTPLLSWRVLLLPFIERQDLFDEFRLDEPWDGPHNLPLVIKMPGLYAAPAWRKIGEIPTGHTLMHV